MSPRVEERLPVRVLLVHNAAALAARLTASLVVRFPTGALPEVVTVVSGEEALMLAAENPIDLVVSDLVLPRPGMSGPYTLIRLRELSPNLHTVLISRYPGLEALTSDVADAYVVHGEVQHDSFQEEVVEVVWALLSGSAKPSQTSPRVRPSVRSEVVEGAQSDTAHQETEKVPSSGLVAGKYQIESELGRGGMGAVYSAKDTFIHRRVAVKLVQVEPGADLKSVHRRMRREATISGRLTHPNIVTLHDAGVDGERIYLVMELVAGSSLDEILGERGALPRSEATAITLQILSALTYAHKQGIVHRDLKPANILVADDGSVKVTDFGVAKMLSMAMPEGHSAAQLIAEDVTAEGMVIGTVAYMAPEQLRGEAVDHRTDIYAVGALLFEMVHGRRLADILSPLARALRPEVEGNARNIPVLAGERRLSQIIARALAVDRDERYASSRALARALQRLDHSGSWFRLPWGRNR
jgi:CheY-like chemotaxis protein